MAGDAMETRSRTTGRNITVEVFMGNSVLGPARFSESFALVGIRAFSRLGSHVIECCRSFDDVSVFRLI